MLPVCFFSSSFCYQCSLLFSFTQPHTQQLLTMAAFHITIYGQCILAAATFPPTLWHNPFLPINTLINYPRRNLLYTCMYIQCMIQRLLPIAVTQTTHIALGILSVTYMYIYMYHYMPSVHIHMHAHITTDLGQHIDVSSTQMNGTHQHHAFCHVHSTSSLISSHMSHANGWMYRYMYMYMLGSLVVEPSSREQRCVGSNPTWGSSSFSLKRKKWAGLRWWCCVALLCIE